jgi:hypothetical protein
MALRVREATPAISAATTYSVDDGNDNGGSRGVVANVNERDIATMLVSDMEGILPYIAVGVNDERTTRWIIKSGAARRRGGGPGGCGRGDGQTVFWSIEVKRIFAKKGTQKSLWKKSERARKASQRQLCIMHSFCTNYA